MRRRTFIAGLGSAAAWPVAARGQQPAVPVVGSLIPQSADEVYKTMTVPFLQGLKEAGYVEGQKPAHLGIGIFSCGPCVDGSGLASAFFTRAAVVGAAMCSAC
jgi:hypothetical protein